MDTDKLAKWRAIADKATVGEWIVGHPGHGERCEPAYIEIIVEGRREHQIIIDHRRDYSDPKPDAAFIATFNPETVKAMLDVAECAAAIPRKPSPSHVLMTPGYAELQRALGALAEKIK